MKKAIVIVLAGAVMLGLACRAHVAVGVGVGASTPEETAYLERAMRAPLTFSLPEAEAAEAWGRIKGFVAEHSAAKIQTATETRIETVAPSADKPFGYVIVRTARNANHEFTVSCVCIQADSAGKERNAHLLAHYAVSGELMPKLIAQ